MPPVRQLSKPVEPSPAKDDFAHWAAGTLKCRCPGCGGKEYPARCYGPWAVFDHGDPGKPEWELVHVKVRHAAVAGMEDRESCFRVGDFLQRRFPLVMRLGTVEEIRAKFGDMGLIHSINEWTKRCKYLKKFVDPTF